MFDFDKSVLLQLDEEIRDYFSRHKPYGFVEAPNPKKLHKLMRMPVCPICEFVCEHDTYYKEHIMIEEHITCPNKHYSYTYVTGSDETVVGSTIVHSHCTDTKEERNYKIRLINLAITHEREKWRKQNAESGAGQKS